MELRKGQKAKKLEYLGVTHGFLAKLKKSIINPESTHGIEKRPEDRKA